MPPSEGTRKTIFPLPLEWKAQIVLEVFREEQTLAQIAAATGVHVNMLCKWKTQAVERLPEVFNTENQALHDLESQ